MQPVPFVTKSVLLAMIVTISSSALAGELGPTSRAFVSISVSIPPRLAAVELHPAALATGDPQSRQFCVLSKGIETYSVSLLPTQSASDGAGKISQPYPRVAVAWNDGERGRPATSVKMGTTVSGFRVGTPDSCSRGDVGAATLKIADGDASQEPGPAKPALTVIIGAD